MKLQISIKYSGAPDELDRLTEAFDLKLHTVGVMIGKVEFEADVIRSRRELEVLTPRSDEGNVARCVIELEGDVYP